MNTFDWETLSGKFDGIGFTMRVEYPEFDKLYEQVVVDETDHDLYHKDPDECYSAFCEWSDRMYDWLPKPEEA